MTTVPGAKAKRRRLFEAQGGVCCYCERPVFILGTVNIKAFAAHHGLTYRAASGRRATLEHLQWRADGGRHHMDNLAVACEACNAGRGARSWVEFKTLVMSHRRAA